MTCLLLFKDSFLQVTYNPMMHYKHWNLFFGHAKTIQIFGWTPSGIISYSNVTNLETLELSVDKRTQIPQKFIQIEVTQSLTYV